VNSLANYISLLASDEALRKKLGKEAAKVAREDFHPDKIVPKYEQLYKKIIEE
jgi:glycosyltransferase involved in cell wall biosynthesis